MALTNTTAQGGVNQADVIANFKEVYGEFKDLVPADLKMSTLVKFASGDRQIGKEFIEPVVLSMEGGVTYGGDSGQIYDLNKYVALSIQDARVKSSEMVLRSAISQATVARSATDKNSFKRALTLLIGNMQKSMYHRLEIALLYGQDSIGVIESVTASHGGDDSKILVKIKDAEWAAGIWVGTNRHKVDILNAALSTKRAIPSSGTSLVIDGYDFDARTIVLQGLDSTGQGVDISSNTFVDTDKLFFQGEVIAGATPEHLNMIGLKAIAEKRGVLFSINNTNLPLFQGNIVDCGTVSAPAKLSFLKVEQASARSVEKGVTESTMTSLVSVHSWNDLLVDQAAKRRYTGAETATLKEGGQELEFFGQTGKIKIVPSTYVKEGYAFVFCEKDLMRIGANDVTMEPPGYSGEPIRFLEDANGFQARIYSDQALFTSRPGGVTVVRYVTNSRLTPDPA